MQNLAGEQLPAGVEPFKDGGDYTCPAHVLGGQKFDTQVSIRQASQGVEAWGQLEADMGFYQPGGIQTGCFNHRLDAQALRPA